MLLLLVLKWLCLVIMFSHQYHENSGYFLHNEFHHDVYKGETVTV
jgi:hypothetical protein